MKTWNWLVALIAVVLLSGSAAWAADDFYVIAGGGPFSGHEAGRLAGKIDELGPFLAALKPAPKPVMHSARPRK